MGKPEILHRSKLFGGRQTAQQVHQQHAWAGGKCCVCNSGDVAVQLRYYQSPLDLVVHEPRMAAILLDQSEDGQLPTWQSKYGPMVPYWLEYACSADQRAVEQAAARLPSYVLVEIDRGVGADKTVSAVPRSYRPRAKVAA